MLHVLSAMWNIPLVKFSVFPNKCPWSTSICVAGQKPVCWTVKWLFLLCISNSLECLCYLRCCWRAGVVGRCSLVYNHCGASWLGCQSCLYVSHILQLQLLGLPPVWKFQGTVPSGDNDLSHASSQKCIFLSSPTLNSSLPVNCSHNCLICKTCLFSNPLISYFAFTTSLQRTPFGRSP